MSLDGMPLLLAPMLGGVVWIQILTSPVLCSHSLILAMICLIPSQCKKNELCMTCCCCCCCLPTTSCNMEVVRCMTSPSKSLVVIVCLVRGENVRYVMLMGGCDWLELTSSGGAVTKYTRTTVRYCVRLLMPLKMLSLLLAVRCSV